MRRFQKKPDVTFVFIPGVGRVAEGRVLEGDEFAKFVPSLLVEVPNASSVPGGLVLTEVLPVPDAPDLTPKPPVVLIPPPPPPSPVLNEEMASAEDAKKEEKKLEVPKPKPSSGKKPPSRR